ncbi:MAG: DUF4097 family beta strand repeat-containing protein [Thermoanaerobaculia bacterium]|nr:DUF4097 family beta strand repeat-containing protein [Thermoanaerobaculia bacterium]
MQLRSVRTATSPPPVPTPAIPLTLAAVALGAILAMAPIAAQAETLSERFETVVEVDPASSVAVRNTNGNVSVTIWDRDQVEIVAEKRARSGDRQAAAEALEEIRIDIERSPGRLAIETELPRSSNGVLAWLLGRHVDASVSYEIRVPRTAPLEVVTVNGRVSSSGPSGEQRLRTTNGRIEVGAAGGDVDARTTNGSIDVALDSRLERSDVELSTTNGSITLRLPDDLRGRLEARTVNGRISTELPVTLESSRSRRRLDGDLNGGGANRIGLRTVNGSISVLELAG